MEPSGGFTLVGQYTYCASSNGARQSLQQKASSSPVALSSSIIIAAVEAPSAMLPQFCKCVDGQDEVKTDSHGYVLHAECCAQSTHIQFVAKEVLHDASTAASLGKLLYRVAEKMEVDAFSEAMDTILTNSKKRRCPSDSNFGNEA